MNPYASGRRGYTLIELMVSMSITLLAIAGATAGWVFVTQGERVNSVQAELDMNVRQAMEKVKRDLRLSAMDKVFFYPPGPGPYTAISFPILHDHTNDAGQAENDVQGSNIVWDQTVVYHVWNGTPYCLRRTVFDPRDNTLTDAQLMEQLTSVVTNGDGTHTYSAAHARTDVVFQNLFTWSIHGNGSAYDGYAPALQWDPGVSFGSFLLTPGPHQLTFNVLGQNSASSGYKIGVDTLVFSPCGLEREAEAQLPATSHSGATPGTDYMAEGAWSGNYQLLFPATGTGATFTLTMNNDRWEETNFRGAGALCRKTTVEFDDGSNPKDFIVRLEGYGYAWQPDQQTGTSTASDDVADSLTGTTVRVFVRGAALQQQGGTIRFSGKTHYVSFTASDAGPLRIKAAYIALAANQDIVAPNAAAPGTQLFFSSMQYGGSYSSGGVVIPAGTSWWCTPASPFAIDATKSYVITFAAGDTRGNSSYWPETHPGMPGSYLVVGNNDPATASAADWSSFSPVQSPNLYAVSAIYTTYPTNGTFTSQIVDTKVDAPAFGNLTWNASLPSGTSLKMKVRTGDDPAMTNAPAWDAVTPMTSGGAIAAPSHRFVQFQAVLDPDAAAWNTPELRDVTLEWTGATKMVDVGAAMTKGPDYGICELTIDGKPLIEGLRIDLTIFEDMLGFGAQPKRLTSTMSAEIDPRNTGL